jgi:hypothetical protein
MMQYIMQMKNFCKGLFTKTTPDRTKISLEQTQIMCSMYASWKGLPKIYATQFEFVKAVNERLGLRKSTTTIIRHIRANTCDHSMK